MNDVFQGRERRLTEEEKKSRVFHFEVHDIALVEPHLQEIKT